MGENIENRFIVLGDFIESNPIVSVPSIDIYSFLKPIRLSNKIVEIRLRRALTVHEFRLLFTILSLLRYIDEDKYEHTITIPKQLLIKTLNLHNDGETNYKRLEDAILGLMEKVLVVELNQQTEDGESVRGWYSFFTGAKYYFKSGKLEVQISNSILEYLKIVERNFTKLYLEHVYKLSSQYSIRLYMLLSRFCDTQYRIDSIDELRSKLGVSDDEYQRFYDFERRVIKQALDEINEKTDICVSYEKIKNKKKVTHIKFLIYKKNNKGLGFLDSEFELEQEYQRWIDEKFQYYFIEYVKREMPYIKNPIGFFKKMKEEDLKLNIKPYIERVIEQYEFQSKVDGSISGFVNTIKFLYDKDYKLCFIFIFCNDEEVKMIEEIVRHRRYNL